MKTSVVLVALALAACAPALRSTKPSAQAGPSGQAGQAAKAGAAPDNKVTQVELEPIKIEAVKTSDGTKVDAYDAASLFEQAGADLEAQRYDEAIKGYDRLVANFPDSRYVVAALYNAGLALEGKQDFAGAATRYRAIVEKHPQATKDVLDALFRMGACYAEVNNWASSAEAFGHLLERTDLALGDRVEALARRGLAQFQLKDLPAAERTFREALNVFHANEATERLDNDFFVAMSQFYLGEIAHDNFRALPLRLPQKQLAVDLEAKAEALLATQARYVDTARIKNPAWATAAGHQIATLYKEFYDAMLNAPMPPELKTDELKKIYFEELRVKIEPLLRKAIHAHELTLGVAERFGLDNDWVRKSNEEMAQLRSLLNPSEKGTGPSPATGSGGKSGAVQPASTPAQPAATTPAATPGAPDDATPRTPRPRPSDEYRPRVVL
ncbi:MAG TPA: tetratricopeptide repeat protein [Polyangia bacterium]|jgi:tetratricopeptide (TPR) repeat protein|nr:tetratricopeptide repeat protein [Polyangia bacterium]